MTEPHLFVWRDWIDEEYGSRKLWIERLSCMYCQVALKENEGFIVPEEQDNSIDTAGYISASCPNCGWIKRKWTSWHTDMPGITSGRWITQRALKNLSISDPQIEIQEIGEHLKRRYSDIHAITPRQFEQLVEAIFKNMGWETRLTKQTRDSGVDIYLMEKSSGVQAIVECKRYKDKISIGLVDRLLGVQLSEGINSAFLVTTSTFTKPARQRTQSPHIRQSGFNLTLIDAEHLTRELDCFNADLPPLHLQNKYHV